MRKTSKVQQFMLALSLLVAIATR
jgi:hypothetical protein